MTYSISWSEKAVKELGRLEKKDQRMIHSALDRIRIRPHRFVRKLVGEQGFRLRVGDFRVILDIKDDVLIIMVITVAHRRNVYDR